MAGNVRNPARTRFTRPPSSRGPMLPPNLASTLERMCFPAGTAQSVAGGTTFKLGRSDGRLERGWGSPAFGREALSRAITRTGATHPPSPIACSPVPGLG
jgi:hypothetical protein